MSYSYDAADRLTGLVDPDSQHAYGYDNADRLTSVDNSGTSGVPQVTLTYGYDGASNRTSVTDSLGGLTSYTYDERNELTQIKQSGSGVSAKRVDYAYDAAMRRTTLTRFSDLVGTTTVQVTAYGYDNADRLTSLTHKTGGGTTRASYGYTLDDANRLTSEARTWASGSLTDTVAYTYTNDDQLAGVTHTNGSFASESFGYDDNGNRNTTGYSTSTGNRLVSDGMFTYTYDDEGNLTTKTETSTGNQTLYTWDHRNRLTAVDTVISSVTTRIGTYTYDALDRRIKVVAGGSTRATLYDGMSAVLDFNGSGTQTARYLQGPVIDEILAREVSGTVAWYLQDRLNTVRDIVDNAGAIIDHVDYDVFGAVVAESSPSNGDRWKYTGRELDSETGLYQYRARYYDAAAGRFVSGDPIRFAS